LHAISKATSISKFCIIHYYKNQEEELKGSILVVLANKQDIEGAMSVTEVKTSSKSTKE
jgi:hypothetical protein